METHLRIVGALLIILSIIHIIFPSYFKWKTDLKNISLMNRQMMYVHIFFIGLVVFLMGLLCFIYHDELIQTPLGKKVLLGFGIFWFIRLLIQFLGYSPELWRGKIFETTVHIFFSLLWIYFTAVFFTAGIVQ